MALWDKTPATFTSFGPISSEVPSSGNFLSRLFKKNKDDSDHSSESSKRSSREVSLERGSSREPSVDRRASRDSSIDGASVAVSFRESSADRTGSRTKGLPLLRTSSDSTQITRHESLAQLSPDDLSGGNGMESGSQQGGSKENLGDTTKRTLDKVLTRLSTIIEKSGPNPQVYRDSDFKQYWMPDSSCRECYQCGDKFTTFRRRHHCRVCGQIFCNACCCQELSGKIIGYKGSIRVCKYCFEIVQVYARRAEPNSGVTAEVLKRPLSTIGLVSPEQASRKGSLGQPQRSLSLRSPSDLDSSSDSLAPFDLTPQTELVLSDNFSERKLLVQDSYQLRTLWSQMLDAERGLEFQHMRFRLKSHPRCVPGNRLVDWLLNQDKAKNRVQAIALGQALIDSGLLCPIQSATTPFRDDFTPYEPTEMSLTETSPDLYMSDDSQVEDSAPQWFQDIKSNADQTSDTCEYSKQNDEGLTVSASCSNVSEDSTGNIKVDERHFEEPLASEKMKFNEEVIESIFGSVDRPLESSGIMEMGESSASFRTLVWNTEDTVTKESFDKLQQEHHEHLTQLTKQLLQQENLPASWADIVISTVDRITLFVKPDVKKNGDDMDIRSYVHIKKIPGGTREQTQLVHGVVFNKNVAHKRMVQRIDNPHVLLLHGSIEYQRVENKMSYLEPQILQEEEFLRKNVKKILSLRPQPKVIVVEKSVSRLAQNFLKEAKIILVYNVKQTVMARLARFLNTDIATSIDSLVGGVTRLGFCHTFSVNRFGLPSGDTKSMIYFDGCANHLGCTVLLRGGSSSELKRVKRILKFMTYASYHSRLEIIFCMDEFLKPPGFEIYEDILTQSKKKYKELGESEKYKKEHNDNEHRKSPQHNKHSQDIANKSDKIPHNDTGSFDPAVNTELDSGNINVCDVTMNSELVCDNPENPVVFVIGEEMSNEETREVNRTRSPRRSNNERSSSFISLKSDGNIETNGELTVNQSSHTQVQSIISSQSEASVQNSNIQNCTVALSQTLHDQNRLNIQTDHNNIVSSPNFQENNGNNLSATNTPEMVWKHHLSGPSTHSMPEMRKKHTSGGRDRSPAAQRKLASTQLTDNSDPLNNYLMSHDESIFQSSMKFAEQLVTHTALFKKSLKNLVLSTSPYVKFNLPYLETETGSKCELRKYFPEEIYWSTQFSDKPSASKGRSKADMEGNKKPDSLCKVEIKDPHEFIRCPLQCSTREPSTQDMVARFRAYGGRINIVDQWSQPDSQAGNQARRGRENKGKLSALDMPKSDPPQTDRRVDCLDTYQHQQITVLFSSFSYESENHPSPCVYPWVVTMEFYGRNDTTLGEFLERFCFRLAYNCPSDTCETPMDRHIRRFVHGRGCISLVLKRSTKDRVINIGEQVQMWSWCYKCKQATPRIKIRPETWHMSFSRYLELRFHGGNFQRRVGTEPMCTHSLHHDSFQYFGMRDTVASFKYSSIKLKEIKLPSFLICHQHTVETIHLYRVKDEVKRLTLKITEVYSSILNYMVHLDINSDTVSQLTTEYTGQQQDEKTHMRDMAHTVRENLDTLLTAAGDSKCLALDAGQLVTYGQLEDGLVTLKYTFAEAVAGWNTKLQDLYQWLKKLKQNSTQRKEKDREPVSASAGSGGAPDGEEKGIGPARAQEADGQMNPSPSQQLEDMFSMSGTEFNSDTRRKSDFSIVNMSPSLYPSASETSMDSFQGYGMTPGMFAAGVWPESSGNRLSDSYVVCHKQQASALPPSPLEDSVEKETDPSKLFENMTSPVDIETANPIVSMDTKAPAVTLDTKQVPATAIDTRSDPVAMERKSAPAAVTLETNVHVAMETKPGDLMEAKSSPVNMEIRAPAVAMETNEPITGQGTVTDGKGGANGPGKSSKVAIPSTRKGPSDQPDGTEKLGGIRKTIIDSIWQPGSGAFQLQLPFDACDHHLLPPCVRVPVVVYDHEPSSIIAYSLSSQDYQTKLRDIQVAQRCNSCHVEMEGAEKTATEDALLRKRPSSGKLAFLRVNSTKDVSQKLDVAPDSVRFVHKTDGNVLESPQDDGEDPVYSATIQGLDNTEKLKSATKQPVNLHIELQFADPTARFYCKVYFAEEFRQLRKQIFPDGEDVFVRSLSRCKPWEAKGGKSGSSFCKTDDDRFILKQMSNMEVESFEKFGPEYFQYFNLVEKEQRPTALAKILGVYRIGFRNQQTNNASKQDLLVMENLFYNRSISQTFDLKGSERNRLVKPTRKSEEVVLLDENFLKVSVDTPLYILPYSKTMLMKAISNDSQFLSTNLVMDYSLLVGLDEQNKELVVGIIDYIRTFTWDKKLETILKSNFGGQGKMPTVVSPEVYRTRFLDAMAKYFLPVPDQWSGLGRDVDA